MSSLKRNFTYQMTYQVLTVITPLITSPYLSRILGSEGLGEYSYAFSVSYYFSLFILLGVNNHGTREIAKVRNDKRKISQVFWSIYSIQLVMGVWVFFLYCYTQIYTKVDKTLATIQLLYIISAILDINWFFWGLEKFKITVTRNIAIRLATVTSIFIFVRNPNDISIYTLIMAFSFFLSQLSIWPFAVKELSRIHKCELRIKNNFYQLLILFIPVLAAGMFRYMDKIMLGSMSTKSELGLYDNAEKIMSLPTGFITAVGTVMLPRISNIMSSEKSKNKINGYIRLSLIGTNIVVSAVSFGLAAIAPVFAPWFWGDQFSKCGILIRVISFSTLFVPWSTILRTQYLIPNQKDTIFVRAMVYSAIINLIINYMLIKRWGALGTVVGTVVAEFVLATYQACKIRKDIPVFLYFKEIIPYIFFGVIMFIVTILVSNIINAASLFGLLCAEIFTGVIVYGILVLTYFYFVKKYTIKDIISLVK